MDTSKVTDIILNHYVILINTIFYENGINQLLIKNKF